MDNETIRKYKERFELGKDDTVPSTVTFKAIEEGAKNHLKHEIEYTQQQLLQYIDRMDLSIKEPTPFTIAIKESYSATYFDAIFKKLIEDAESDYHAGKYVLGLLRAAVKAEVIKTTMGGWPANFCSPEMETIEDSYRRNSYRRRSDQYPSEGLKFFAKNKGTLQLHLKWR